MRKVKCGNMLWVSVIMAFFMFACDTEEDSGIVVDGDSYPIDGDEEAMNEESEENELAEEDEVAEEDEESRAEAEEEIEPTPYSAEATKTLDDIVFLEVDGDPFFSLGFHAGEGLVYDGVTEEGCDEDTGVGYLPPETNIEKTKAAYEAGANFIYTWGYKSELMAADERFRNFKTRFYDGYPYGQNIPVEEDNMPILYDRFGEVDLDGYKEEKAEEMEREFHDFINREGDYSPENKPLLPSVEQVGHMSWHPTWRMTGTGDGTGEMLTEEQATRLAKATNMMIGDTYVYVANRFDLSDPLDAGRAALYGQKGDIGEDYEYWLENDDPAHRDKFSSAFNLAHSLRTKGKPEAVIWMWVQGYSFGDSIAKKECRGETSDSWAAGGFPPLWYLKKVITSVIATGATGIVFFGFPNNRWPETEILLKVFRSLSHEDVYEPALLSPRLDLGYDTLFMGEEGYNGKGRAHLIVKWHEESKKAFVIAANPGARATSVDLEFPWTLEKAEILNWETPAFEESERPILRDKTLHFDFERDEGVILRITPYMGE